MFVYNFKESKLPDKSTLQKNINTELLTVQSQLNSAVNKEESIYKSFIDLSIYKYLNFDNASILHDYNSAFSYTNNMLKELKEQKTKIKKIKEFVDNTNFETEEFNNNNFLSEFQDLLEDYYEYKGETQSNLLKEQKKLNDISKKFIPFNNTTKGEVNLAPNVTPKKHPKKTKKVEPPPVKQRVSPMPILENLEPIQPNKKQSKKEIKVEKVAELEKELTKKVDIPKESIQLDNTPKNNFQPDDMQIDNIQKNNNPKRNKIKTNLELVISEKDKQVYLPYYAEDLKEDMRNNEYTSYDELIQDNYVIPLKYYKNQSVARFKEGFRLMREKEYESFKTAFSFGFKLMHNYKLHPAVITACNSYEELDYFLECLEKDDVESFNLFKVRFDVPPMKK